MNVTKVRGYDAEGSYSPDGQWIAFARGLSPEWPAYDLERRATARFDSTSDVVDDPDGELRRIWETVAP